MTEPRYKTLIEYAYEGVYENLLESICRIMGVTVDEVKSGSHKRIYVEPRMIYFKLAHEFYPYNVSMMGRVANRSHSVAFNSPAVVDDVRELRDKYEWVKQTLFKI